jgi:hypothetical protein
MLILPLISICKRDEIASIQFFHIQKIPAAIDFKLSILRPVPHSKCIPSNYSLY